MKKPSTQFQRVFAIMKSGEWRGLAEIKAVSLKRYGKHDSEAAISARLRDFRKPKYGGYIMNAKQPRRGRPFVYQLEVGQKTAA